MSSLPERDRVPPMRMLALCALALVTVLEGCAYECNATNCADGCCGGGGVCYVGGKDPYCGLNGAACQDCSAQQRICGEGVCGLDCVLDSPCKSKDDCCADYLCFEEKCTKCRGGGATCWHKEECCGFPLQLCERPAPYLPFVCR